jgi:hypothetical protein
MEAADFSALLNSVCGFFPGSALSGVRQENMKRNSPDNKVMKSWFIEF